MLSYISWLKILSAISITIQGCISYQNTLVESSKRSRTLYLQHDAQLSIKTAHLTKYRETKPGFQHRMRTAEYSCIIQPQQQTIFVRYMHAMLQNESLLYVHITTLSEARTFLWPVHFIRREASSVLYTQRNSRTITVNNFSVLRSHIIITSQYLTYQQNHYTNNSLPSILVTLNCIPMKQEQVIMLRPDSIWTHTQAYGANYMQSPITAPTLELEAVCQKIVWLKTRMTA